MSDRDPYRDCGAAMRAAVERANAIRPQLKAAQRRVLDAVLVLTASFSRLSDEVYVADVAAIAQVHERTARKALLRLAAEGVIEWTPRRGQRARSTLALPLGETGPQDARLQGGGRGETGPQSPGETGPQDARRPRSTPEEEEGTAAPRPLPQPSAARAAEGGAADAPMRFDPEAVEFIEAVKEATDRIERGEPV